MSRFVFSLRLGTEEVKRIVFPDGAGRRQIVGSNGATIGFAKFDGASLTISIIEGQAVHLAEAQEC